MSRFSITFLLYTQNVQCIYISNNILSNETDHFYRCSAERICLALANSVDPDQLASKKPTDLDLQCFPFSLCIYINNPDQGI